MRGSIRVLAPVVLLLLSTMVAAEQSLTAIQAKPPADDFALIDLQGKIHRLEDFRGKPLIVNFWATWCPPCRREMPSMERAWQQLQTQGVAMVAIDVGEDEAAVAGFLEQTPVSFLMLLDKDSSVVQSWPVLGLPTTFVVDAQGRFVYKAVGGREWDDPALLQQVLDLR
ncbi:MAG: TlpA family protein disulfide reductase [Chromatiales bacterium]|nr:TlpA family protein disulfide reductase [Chromatiales bacterium]